MTGNGIIKYADTDIKLTPYHTTINFLSRNTSTVDIPLLVPSKERFEQPYPQNPNTEAKEGKIAHKSCSTTLMSL